MIVEVRRKLEPKEYRSNAKLAITGNARLWNRCNTIRKWLIPRINTAFYQCLQAWNIQTQTIKLQKVTSNS